SGRDNLLKHGVAYRFKPGNKPVNKGKKYPDKINSGCFGKGHKPWNSTEVGDIRKTTDGYLKIKVGEPNKWDLLHRHLWKQEHGFIPKGMKIRFKDGNPLNCVLDNMELVSYKDHLLKNQVLDFPKELQEVAFLTKKLN